MDHVYTKTLSPGCQPGCQRTPSFVCFDHEYSNVRLSTPRKKEKSSKRKRQATTPTGKTPKQAVKFCVLQDGKRQVRWSVEEKRFLEQYLKDTENVQGSALRYWRKCADDLNTKFPEHGRNGDSCKRMAQRLSLNPCEPESPAGVTEHDGEFSQLKFTTTVDSETQTNLSLPVNNVWFSDTDRNSGDWVFVEPKRELKESASPGAKLVNTAALKRLRTFPDLKKAERAALIDLLCTASSSQIARAIMTSSLYEDIKTLILYDIESDARECANKGSVLYCNQYQNLVQFKWEKILTEFIEKQTFLAEALLAVAFPTGKIGNSKESEIMVPVLGTVYGILMKQRFQKLTLVQKVVSIALANEQTHQKVYDRLQPLGLTLSHSGMLDSMNLISGCFNEKLIDAVMDEKKFRIVGDNINFHVSVSQVRSSSGNRDHMEHWFGSAAIIQNFMCDNLKNNAPQQDLREVPVNTFIINDNEWKDLTFELSVQAARILCDFFPWLHFAKEAMASPVREVPEGMRRQNKVIPLPIQHKNEQKYSDVVEILDSYQELCDNTYEACGKPCQTIHIGGDQLTRERFTGAKRLRAASLTASERYGNLYPVTFELFHLQMSLLTIFYQVLYNTEHTESFTLNSQKIRLLRKDAHGSDVKNHYDSCRDLAVSIIKAYVVEAACEFFGLPDLETVPENIPDVQNMSKEEIRLWLVDQILPIIIKATTISKSTINGSNVEIGSADSDYVHCYGNLVLEIGLIYINLCDIVKFPNRDRLLTLMKYLLMLFKGHNNRSKYALEILRFLSQQISLLSEQKAAETCYGLFVNTGKTVIPADLQMEHLVRLTKGHLRAMCSNVTDTSLMKRSSAFFGMNEIADNFDSETAVITRAQKHTMLSSIEDEVKIVKDLREVRPFSEIPGRHGNSFRKEPKNPVSKLNVDDFTMWIEKHKALLFYEL